MMIKNGYFNEHGQYVYSPNKYCCCRGPAGPPGATGPQGPIGPAGPEGPQGPPGDCCCKTSLKYAIDTIVAADATQNISLITFNTTQKGVVDSFLANGDVVKIIEASGQDQEVYVSLCNTTFITFPNEPVINAQSNYNCTTQSPQCCCNEDIESALRTLLGSSTFPLVTDIDIGIVNNSANFYNIKTVYGICNGIFWGEFKNTVEGNSYGAIPLCSIFNFRKGN